MKWYAYSENSDGTVNMILDHNTTKTIFWVDETDYNDTNLPSTLGVTYKDGVNQNDSYGTNGNNKKGPLTLLKQLKEDTKDWKKTTTLTNYEIEWTKNGNLYGYAINYNDYNARIITVEEVAKITDNITWTFQNGDKAYDLDTKENPKEKSTSRYGWLYDRTSKNCITNGCLNNATGEDIEKMESYWTISPNSSTLARKIHSSGYLGANNIKYEDTKNIGIRPVITVHKNVLQ